MKVEQVTLPAPVSRQPHVVDAEQNVDTTSEETESDPEIQKNTLADPRAMLELKKERRTKKKFDKDETYEYRQPKKKRRTKHMAKNTKSGLNLVDEPEDSNVGVDMNVEKTLETSKANVEVEKTHVIDVSLDDAIDKLMKTPTA